MNRLLLLAVLVVSVGSACGGGGAQADTLFGKGVDATVIASGGEGRDAYALAGSDARFEALEAQITTVLEEHGWRTKPDATGVISAQSADGIRCVVYYDARRYPEYLESSLQKHGELAAVDDAKPYATLVFAVGSLCL